MCDREGYNIADMHYDLCLPWYWEYDDAFVAMIASACLDQGLSLLQVTPANLLEATTALYEGRLTFKTLLNRGQGEPTFEPISRWALENRVRRINPAELSAWSEDKATMHLEFINAGLQTPYTILLSPYLESPLLPPIDLAPLAHGFVIKPSNGGGGEGVILGASTVEQIQRARMQFPGQKYLLQSYITPQVLNARPAWFRVFYANGETFPCWWATDSHIYQVVQPWEESAFNLHHLHTITRQIAAICKLDWFSTEIALADHFVVVDYVNDEIDTRVQSRALDGVPDEVINHIAHQLVRIARAHSTPAADAAP